MIDKTERFTNGKLKFIVLWSTRNIKSLFPLKDQVKHLSSVIYEGKCSCGIRYIGETIRNSYIGWNEHESTKGKSKPAKHLTDNKSHMFTWKVLASAPLHCRKREILEAFFITKLKPDINNQIEYYALSLFQHGVTWIDTWYLFFMLFCLLIIFVFRNCTNWDEFLIFNS